MGRGLALLLLLCACGLHAKTHFVNRGIFYHIGDNRYERSEDKEFVGTYPVVGQEWIQAFTVSEADTVKLSIATVRGIDECPYCRVTVGIDDRNMGRLFPENNRTAFNTLSVFAAKVEPGRTYLIKILSLGEGQVDDFVVEGVSVETDRAEITFLKPGPIIKMPDEPMPQFSRAPAAAAPGPCPRLQPLQDWRLGAGKAADTLDLGPAAQGPGESGALGALAPGQSVELFVQGRAADSADRISRSIELLWPSADGDSGWVLTLDAQGNAAHGNIRVKGSHRAAAFDVGAFRAGAWNALRLSHCWDGMLRLDINGSPVGAALAAGGTPRDFALRVLGQRITLAGAQKFR